ncbi:MAG: hypothetical protein MUQ10_07870 [Anaerolineae bacterium]|nr:hypothetical protein [Anaerolineae bacterium]
MPRRGGGGARRFIAPGADLDALDADTASRAGIKRIDNLSARHTDIEDSGLPSVGAGYARIARSLIVVVCCRVCSLDPFGMTVLWSGLTHLSLQA